MEEKMFNSKEKSEFMITCVFLNDWRTFHTDGSGDQKKTGKTIRKIIELFEVITLRMIENRNFSNFRFLSSRALLESHLEST